MTELTLREYSQEIEGMLERNSYDEAVAHCRHILQHYPKYVEAYRLLGKMALDREDDQHASDLFARVLSADPSDFVSRAGLAIINDRKSNVSEAVWHMERAYELEPGNPVIQDELRKLYGRRDGVEPQRIPLTRGALARLYLNGELHSEAVAELRAMLAVEPDRVDLQVLLAEALWRDEQKLEASDVALQVLDKMPYCLDANLILGEIWTSSGREEDAEVPLKRALALDPEGTRAAMLFGKSPPIPVKPVQVVALEYTAPVQEEVTEAAPDWLVGLGSPAEATAGGAEEVPTWLQGIGQAAEAPSDQETLAEIAAPPIPAELVEEAPSWLSGLSEPMVPSATVEAAQEVEGEQMPDWLSQLRAEVTPLPTEAEAAPEEAGVPDWLQALRPPEAELPAPAVSEVEEGVPDWLTRLRAEVAPLPTAEIEEAPAKELAAPAEAEIPDWLQALKPEGVEQPAPSIETPESDWLTQLGAEVAPMPVAEAAVEESFAAPEPAQIPDWLQALKPESVEAAVPSEETPEWLSALPTEPVAAELIEAVPVAEETPEWFSAFPTEPVVAELVEAAPVAEEQPAWLTGEGAMPSAEEAMAFFAKLSAGKEEELAAQAKAEGEERMASIMGRKPETKPEVKPQAVPPPPLKEVPPTPVIVPEPPKVKVPPPAAVAQPAWLTGEGAMPSAEEAMAFFAKLSAGKEEELAAQAKAEGEERMASIMGRKPETKPEVKPQAVTPPPLKVKVPPAPVIVPEPPKVKVPPPAAVAQPAWLTGEGAMPSAEEAMAFFARLSAGKEEELAAQAKAEGEERMASIMGRKPEAVPPSVPVAIPEPAKAEAPIEELPAWPEWPVEPEIELSPEPASQVPTGWAAWAEAQIAQEALPAVESETIKGFAATWPAPQVAPMTVEAPVEETPVEAVPVTRVPVAEAAGPDWWYQTLADEEGPAEEELGEAVLVGDAISFVAPAPVQEPVRAPRVPSVVTPPPAPAVPVAPPPPEPRPAARGPKRLVRTKPTPATPPKPTVDLDGIMARLRANPDDHDALLDLARGHVQLSDLRSAHGAYEELVRRNAAMDDVISDLENVIEEHPEDVDLIRLLGDAHMKAGNLQKALKLYRQALKKL